MIFDFIVQPAWFLNRLIKVIGIRKVLSALYMLLFIAASVNAQVNTLSSANYKRPYDVGKKENFSGSEGQIIIITKKRQDRHSVKQGFIWRYSTTPAELIINIDPKNNTGKKSKAIRPNYKAQH